MKEFRFFQRDLRWRELSRWGTLGLMDDKAGLDPGSTLHVRKNVSLAPLTTLELGGPASSFTSVDSVDMAKEAIRWAHLSSQPVAVLGGGSNVVISDSGFAGLAIRAEIRGISIEGDEGVARVTAAAGETWDEIVKMTVAENLVGLECLSGIPGWVGATPIQNVGAYGQDISTVIDSVNVLDLESLEERTLEREACGFGYRSSIFRRFPGRFLVVSVTFFLEKGGRPKVKYRELRQALGPGKAVPSLQEIRRTVLELRRSKSMVLEDQDANRRSVGSFFVNPVIDDVKLAALNEHSRRTGALAPTESVPTFPGGESEFKVPAAWLIEKAGFSKGLRRGGVGISSKHALALVHFGEGTSEELVALAREIRNGVDRKFAIKLEPEPVFLGFPSTSPLED